MSQSEYFQDKVFCEKCSKIIGYSPFEFVDYPLFAFKLRCENCKTTIGNKGNRT